MTIFFLLHTATANTMSCIKSVVCATDKQLVPVHKIFSEWKQENLNLTTTNYIVQLYGCVLHVCNYKSRHRVNSKICPWRQKSLRSRQFFKCNLLSLETTPNQNLLIILSIFDVWGHMYTFNIQYSCMFAIPPVKLCKTSKYVFVFWPDSFLIFNFVVEYSCITSFYAKSIWFLFETHKHIRLNSTPESTCSHVNKSTVKFSKKVHQ